MKSLIFTFFILSQFTFSSEILISGAASLKEYLEKNISDYKKINPYTTFSLNLGSSGALKRQLEQGAPVDIIFLADRKLMIELKEKNMIKNEEVILENRLVLIKNKKSSNTEDPILAIGDPNHVPAGKYATLVLESIPLKNYSLVYGKDVRSVLSYVELGEADYGIIYLTDSKISNNSEIVHTFDSKLHTPIEYSIGISNDSNNYSEAESFIEFLKGKSWND